jgi:hypothetical protein
MAHKVMHRDTIDDAKHVGHQLALFSYVVFLCFKIRINITRRVLGESNTISTGSKGPLVAVL